MSEKILTELGAECVGGDLILNRVVVGMYRHGQFILTPEGQAVVDENVVDAVVTEAPAARVARKARSADAAKAPAEAEAPAATE